MEDFRPFEKIDVDVLKNILSKLPIKDRASSSAVSRNFNDVNSVNIFMNHLKWLNSLSSIRPTTLKGGKIEILVTNGTRKIWIILTQHTTWAFDIRIFEKDNINQVINISTETKEYTKQISLEGLNVYQKMVITLIAILFTIKNYFIKNESLQSSIYGYKPSDITDDIESITEWGNTYIKNIFAQIFMDITKLEPIIYMNVPNHLYNKELGHVSRSSVTIIKTLQNQQIVQMNRRKFMLIN